MTTTAGNYDLAKLPKLTSSSSTMELPVALRSSIKHKHIWDVPLSTYAAKSYKYRNKISFTISTLEQSSWHTMHQQPQMS